MRARSIHALIRYKSTSLLEELDELFETGRRDKPHIWRSFNTFLIILTSCRKSQPFSVTFVSRLRSIVKYCDPRVMGHRGKNRDIALINRVFSFPRCICFRVFKLSLLVSTNLIFAVLCGKICYGFRALKYRGKIFSHLIFYPL